MGKTLDNVYKHQSLVYKYFLYVVSIALIVFFFPKGGKFKYEFQKGKPWQYENLYAPIDFSIKKTQKEIEEEKSSIRANKTDYYTYNASVVSDVRAEVAAELNTLFQSGNFSSQQRQSLRSLFEEVLEDIYTDGIFQTLPESESTVVVKNNEAQPVSPSDYLVLEQAKREISSRFSGANMVGAPRLTGILRNSLKANLFYDEALTESALSDELSKISYTRGEVDQGKLIIAKGEIVESEDFKILNSLKDEYESKLWMGSNYYFILLGYTVLVALVLIMLFLFLKRYRNEIFQNNNKVTFIFFNILLMVLATTLMTKHYENYIYMVPLCILPLVLKNFFDARLGLFVHVLTVLILGFVVPNSFEYIFLQTIAGIVTILTASELYKRANLFISVGQITLIYIVGYFAFHAIHEGNLQNIEWILFGVFVLNGLLTLFAQPLIYMFEKVFGLVSDVSLLELSDTNSKLLKELSDKAPGTFHHSLQVANLAEAAANEIGANAMLVRVGALYHDIGKMERPTYFTENQITNVNPHDDLPPKESAKIIVDHVINGIEIARKSNLPDRVIDFIRTHHGTTVVYYFYKKQQELDQEVDEEDFKYPGPIPFSKETAILMMSDAVEAASKSLKDPTFTIIDEFVEKIVKGQMQANQYLNANITLKEIEMVKKVLKQKLTNIYHLRVEYPE
ncbi:7TM receptor with intracellular metal dependent phosphohydrolase [Allomuricauda ruestringensis DSM 13258]|uniref:7TM receptor with intracellular metal dependent phosphohydrolase n=1 Tax=Allomuricauda ruestringensis (strain DSM 13258 / CIP 107369 / LMG 19739 / B1) TaxID=886377 RepID=G2PPJ2_ALLRU|nr:HDIG domain-containing metalloprotein [Allomuricauda ruestringensis]AEM71493.1 7TM receptor with intracellular metal dependent phosphohydrolase [Allomuricauda ruestringensis DSM 13258]